VSGASEVLNAEVAAVNERVRENLFGVFEALMERMMPDEDIRGISFQSEGELEVVYGSLPGTTDNVLVCKYGSRCMSVLSLCVICSYVCICVVQVEAWVRFVVAYTEVASSISPVIRLSDDNAFWADWNNVIGKFGVDGHMERSRRRLRDRYDAVSCVLLQ